MVKTKAGPFIDYFLVLTTAMTVAVSLALTAMGGF